MTPWICTHIFEYRCCIGSCCLAAVSPMCARTQGIWPAGTLRSRECVRNVRFSGAGTLTLFGALKVYKQTVAAWGPGGMGFGWGGVPVGFVLHRCCSIVGKQCPQIV